LRGDLDNILARALKPLAAERYATVPALADDLRRHLHHEPVSARPDAFSYRAAKFLRRHRWGVAATAALVLAVLAGTAGTAWQAIEARRERDEALFQAERALGKGNFMNLMLGAIGGVGRPLTQREILDRGVTLVDKQFGKDPRTAIDLLLPIAGQYMTLGDIQKELEVMQRAAAFAAASGDAQLMASVACQTVETEIHRQRLDLARAQLQFGLEAMARMTRTEPSVAIACLGAQADVAEATGDLGRAVEHIAEAMRRAEQGGHTRGNQYPALLHRLGGLHNLRGDLVVSFEILKRKQRLKEASGRAGSLEFLADLRDEAVFLMNWGEYRAAQTIIDSIGPRLLEASGGSLPPSWFEHTRGMLLWRFGDLEGAHHALHGSADRSRAQGNVQGALPTEFALAQVLLDLGNLSAAEATLATVEQAQPAKTAPYRRLTPAGVRARLYLARGASADAVRVIDAELARVGWPPAKDSTALAAALMLGARAHAASGDARHAQQLAQAAVGVAERMAREPQRSADVGEALLVLAQTQRASDDPSASIATAKRAVVGLTSGLGPQHALTLEAQALAAH
jgi:eukaryotic-like serine/threonine-protein kinase